MRIDPYLELVKSSRIDISEILEPIDVVFMKVFIGRKHKGEWKADYRPWESRNGSFRIK